MHPTRGRRHLRPPLEGAEEIAELRAELSETRETIFEQRETMAELKEQMLKAGGSEV